MLAGKDREIAVKAIAESARGTPSEVAAQILAGISVLDSPGKPLVVWPVNLTAQEKLEALEREIVHVRQFIADAEAMRVRREQWAQEGSKEGHESVAPETLSAQPGVQKQEGEAPSARSGEEAEARSPAGTEPALEASDVSQ